MQRRHRPNRQSRRGGHNNQQHRSSNPSSNSSSPHPSRTSTPSQHHSNSPRPPRSTPNYSPVPSFSSIRPGTGVSIILKQDQPTGRQVTGIVNEVLTRGDHPRGVKVRLRDGRVGRVQVVVSEEEGLRGEEVVGGADADLGRNGEAASSFATSQRGGRGRRGFRHVQDVRDDEYVWDENRRQAASSAFWGLEALEARDVESSGRRGEDTSNVSDLKSETATCPVCGIFEGDERAVAHHVESHFADSG